MSGNLGANLNKENSIYGIREYIKKSPQEKFNNYALTKIIKKMDELDSYSKSPDKF